MTEQALPDDRNQLLLETSKLLNSTLDLEELSDLIASLSARISQAETGAFLEKEKASETLRVRVYHQRGSGKKGEIELPTQGIAGWVAQNDQPIISNQARSDARFSPELEEQIGFSIDSLMSAPVMRRGKLWGAVAVFNKMNHKEFDQPDLEVLSSLADQIAVVLENSYLLRKLKERTLETQTLLEAEKSLSSTLDLSQLLELILDSLRKVVRYDAVAIYLIDAEKGEIEHIKARGFDAALEPDLHLKIGEGLAGWAAKKHTSLIVPDVKKDPRYIQARVETRSEMVVPISSQERIIGVFNLESNRPNAYHQDDLELAEAFASLAAVSLERARQYEEVLGKRKLEEEISIAKRIQQSFLPRRKPQLSGFDISGVNLPSEQVGGDYYDFIPIIENQMGIAIADVSGKGIPAALIMASYRASLIAEIRNNYAIRSIMFKVNNLLYESTEPENYVTALYGVLDTKNHIFTFSNAGHNPPILRHANGEMEELTQGGVALGVFENSKYEERPLGLTEGDIMVFYTDGVTEAENRQEEEFGIERLKQVIENSCQLSARTIRDGIHGAVRDFTDGLPQSDDITLIVVKAL
jgi:sigma-B regulation protein RsbU (phosphoserine phosphatase)